MGTAWKAYYKPIAVGQRLLIKPTWEEAEADGRLIELDPGMAFWHGHPPHHHHVPGSAGGGDRERETVFDVGRGSGILSIAARLGAGKSWPWTKTLMP